MIFIQEQSFLLSRNHFLLNRIEIATLLPWLVSLFSFPWFDHMAHPTRNMMTRHKL